MDGKKSFLIYTELLEAIEDLDTEQLGLLFKQMLEYCNDLSPKDPTDKMVKIAWKFIRQDLKRDLESWKTRCEINRQNGKLGGRPKKTQKNPTVFEENPESFSKKPKKPKKPDNDNDNDNDNDKDKESESINNNSTPTLEDIKAYIEAKNYKTDADKFYSCYQSKGWKGVEDWKAKVDYWESKDYPQSYNNVNDGWEELE